MIRLVLVELTRLRWRRAVALLVAVALVVPLVVVAARAYDTRPPSEADRASAQAQVDSERAYVADAIARCVRRAEDTPRAQRRCDQRYGYEPRVEDYLYRQPLRLAAERRTSGLAVVAILAVLMLLAGTTFVGHDWNTGSMSNQLLFEPRRLRVWTAKAVAVSLLALGVAVVGLTLFWGGLLAVAQSRDLDPSGQVVTDLTQHAVRGAAMIVVGALGGYALTTLSRSTVFTLGALFAVSVAGGLLFALLPSAALRFEPATNAVAVVNGRAVYYVDVPESCFGLDRSGGSEECENRREVGVEQGTVYYGVLLLVGCGLSAASYRRRDVP